jgi:RpiB/LacA/LacB family sugar-phosphate isomerase
MQSPGKVFFGSDHAGFELKALLVQKVQSEFPEIHWEDCGPESEESTDYPVFAEKVARKVVAENGLGILVCGSGIGVSISANKVAGIRAALCWDVTSTRLSREHNDANVLCLGSRLIGREVAFDMVRQFLRSEFQGGRHAERLELIRKLEGR